MIHLTFLKDLLSLSCREWIEMGLNENRNDNQEAIKIKHLKADCGLDQGETFADGEE